MFRYAVFFVAALFTIAAIVLVLGQFKTDADKATALVKAGQFDKAKPITEQLLLSAKKAEFSKDADGVVRFSETVATLNRLAVLYRDQGRYTEAEQLFKQILEITEKVLGKDHLDTADSLNNLAILYHDQGRYAEAEQLLIQTKDIFKKELGRDHLNTIIALNNLAQLYIVQGNYHKAEPQLKQALEVFEETLGKDHLHSAVVLNNLGGLYQAQSRFIIAEPLYAQALAIREKKLGAEHLDTVISQNNLAMLYRDQGRYAEAEPLLKRSLEIFEKTLGKDHPSTATVRGNLAQLLKAQERYTEAEPLLIQALEITEKVLGKDHPNTAVSLNNLAQLHILQGHYDEAELQLKRALEIYEKAFGKDHPDTAASLHNLAQLYQAQGRYAEAKTFIDRAIEISGNYSIAAKSPVYFTSRAMLYWKMDSPEKAIADLKQAMELSLEMRKQASDNDEHRAQTFAQYYNIFETMAHWQYILGIDGDINEAYEAMERSRAQSFQDLIDANGIDLLDNIPAETSQKLRADEVAASTDVVSYEKQLEVLSRRKDMTISQKRAEKTRLTEALRVAQEKLVDAMSTIRHENRAHQLMVAKDRKPIAFDTICQELVQEKALALEYLLGTENSYLLLYGVDTAPKLLPLSFDKRQAEIFGVEEGALTAKKMETLLQNKTDDDVLFSIANPENSDKEKVDGLPDEKTQMKLAVLWEILVPDDQIRVKITSENAFDRLLILPDGALSRFPFEALIVEPNIDSPVYLLDSGPTTVYAPSASIYYNLKHRQTESGNLQVLTVGNPDYEVQSHSMPTDMLSEMRNNHRASHMGTLPPPLVWTQVETLWVAGSCEENGISVTRFDSKESTEANVRNNVSRQKIVHLACHGLVENDLGNALFCTLALTVGDPNVQNDDGFLELAEMFELDLTSCELAILSACEMNLGSNQYGEGTWSMGRGMLTSGAKRVVTTDWTVADQASARLVHRFVEAVTKSDQFDNVADSLRQAKLSIRNGHDNAAWKHPSYWAPFVLIGN